MNSLKSICPIWLRRGSHQTRAAANGPQWGWLRPHLCLDRGGQLGRRSQRKSLGMQGVGAGCISDFTGRWIVR